MKKLKLTLAALCAMLLMAVLLAAFTAAPVSADTIRKGVDFSWHGTLDPEAFKAEGVEFVVRYLAGGQYPEKELTQEEADMWSAAGIQVVVVWETTAGRALEGYEAGYEDASIAFPQAHSLGMPEDKPVYFAVDVDTNGPSVRDYFQGVYDWARTHFADGMATPRIGIYGGYEPVKWIMDAGYAAYGWQTVAWMKGRGWLDNVMQQHTIEVEMAGTNVDLNRVAHNDYGGWISTRVAKAQETQVAQAEVPAAEPEETQAEPTLTVTPPSVEPPQPLDVATPEEMANPAEVLPVAGPSSLEVRLPQESATLRMEKRLGEIPRSWEIKASLPSLPAATDSSVGEFYKAVRDK